MISALKPVKLCCGPMRTFSASFEILSVSPGLERPNASRFDWNALYTPARDEAIGLEYSEWKKPPSFCEFIGT